MVDIAYPEVHVIAYTNFMPSAASELVGFETDRDGGQALAEFAGRACYQAWKKNNPATATNAGYIENILNHGHLSVLEHASVTFYITGISRSLTHELVRHRHFSYSQLSQRYVAEESSPVIIPPDIMNDFEDDEIMTDFLEAAEASKKAYAKLAKKLTDKLSKQGKTGFDLRKAVRQAARGVLINSNETKIVVTGNYRALRHFIDMRASKHADLEIRGLAIEMLRHLRVIAPSVFGDYEISELEDGSLIATGKYSYYG